MGIGDGAVAPFAKNRIWVQMRYFVKGIPNYCGGQKFPQDKISPN
jgi:hypothetical protein